MADGRVIVEAILDAANVTKQLGKLKNELKGVTWENLKEGDKKAKALGKAFENAGTACSAKLTAPIVAAGAAAMGVASKYESSASKIQAALGVTAEEAEHFRDIGANIYEGAWGDSMEDVTDALLTVKQNFKDLDDASLQSITESALMLRDTFDMDVSESIRGAENLATAFGLSGEQAMDLITVAAQNGLNSTDELGDNLAEYATLFQENGYSAEQMFSVLQAGLDAGAYNLDKVNDLVKEFGIRIADGSIKQAVDDLGGSFKETFDTLQESGASNQEIFTALAQEISKCGTEQEKAAAVSAIFGSMGEDAGFKVIEAMGQAANSYEDVAGAAEKAKTAAGDNFATSMESASRTIMGALEPLGEPLLNIATKVADLIRGFGEWFSGLTEGSQTAILVLAGIAAAIGPVLLAIGKIVPMISTIGPAFAAFKVTAAASLASVKTALGALVGPVGIVIGVIAALAAGFIALYNNCEPFRNAVDGLVSVLGEAFAPVLQALGDLFNNVLGPALAQFGQWIGELMAGALTQFGEFISTVIAPALQQFGDFLTTTVIPALQQFGAWIGENIMPVLQEFSNFLGGVLGAAFQGISDTVNNIVLPALQSFGDFFNNTLLPAIQSFSDWLSNTWNDISSTCESVWNDISSFLSGLWDDLSATCSSVWDGVSGFLSSTWNDISSTCESVWNDVGSFLKGLWDDLSSTCNSVWNDVSSSLSSIWDGISSNASSIWDGIKSTITDVVDGAKNAIETGFRSACDAGSSAFEGLRSAVDGAMNAIRSIVDDVCGAVRSAFDWIQSTASSIGSAIGGLLGIRMEEPVPLPLQPINPELPPIDPASLPISWYATGGIFNSPSLIGIGEAGPEAVVPLNGSAMKPFAEAVAQNMGNSQTVTVNVKIDKFINQTEQDIDELVNRVSRDISRMVDRTKRQRGYGF